jgi:hypothetical protein
MAIWFCNNDRVISCCHGAGGAVFDSGPNGQRTFDRRKHEMCLIGLSGLASTACPRPVWICCGACLTACLTATLAVPLGDLSWSAAARATQNGDTHTHTLSHTHTTKHQPKAAVLICLCLVGLHSWRGREIEPHPPPTPFRGSPYHVHLATVRQG